MRQGPPESYWPFAILCALIAAVILVLANAGRGANKTSAHQILAGLQCIHSHEGRWDDPGAPYFGGLQMDMAFQKAYGREYLAAFGTADRWPVALQLAVGMKAYLRRGWSPWRNTARLCGLR